MGFGRDAEWNSQRGRRDKARPANYTQVKCACSVPPLLKWTLSVINQADVTTDQQWFTPDWNLASHWMTYAATWDVELRVSYQSHNTGSTLQLSLFTTHTIQSSPKWCHPFFFCVCTETGCRPICVLETSGNGRVWKCTKTCTICYFFAVMSRSGWLWSTLSHTRTHFHAFCLPFAMLLLSFTWI